MMLRILTPYFTAGCDMEDGVCVRAAPILSWAVGNSDREIMAYCSRKGWRVEEIAYSSAPLGSPR